VKLPNLQFKRYSSIIVKRLQRKNDTSLNKQKNEVVETLQMSGIISFENLTFIETSLTKDDNWDKAMKGCKYVLSVASPVFFTLPKDENETVRPAVGGVLRVG
jgi:hypothetical protein